MTARIKREFNFIAGIWLHDEYQIGMYSFTMFIDIKFILFEFILRNEI